MSLTLDHLGERCGNTMYFTSCQYNSTVAAAVVQNSNSQEILPFSHLGNSWRLLVIIESMLFSFSLNGRN